MSKKGKKGKKKAKKVQENGGGGPLCATAAASFRVQSFRVHWVSADPDYHRSYRLVPMITLFEADSETRHEGPVAYLQFRHEKDLGGASYDEESQVYELDYPLEMADSVLTLLGSGAPLEVVYFEKDKKRWADLRTSFLEIADEGEGEGEEPHEHDEEDEEDENIENIEAEGEAPEETP